MSSLLNEIIAAAPPGSDPFAFAFTYVSSIIPEKPEWYFHQIIATGAVAAVNLILTIASTVVMARRRGLEEKSNFWLFNLRYGHSSGLPYIVPNAVAMFLVWNLVFMSLMQPYIWLNYVVWKHPTLEKTSKIFFWYGFIFIWDGIGMWTSAFGTLYATLLPHMGTSGKLSFLHPILLNFFLIVPPVGLTITQIATTTISAIRWHDLVYIQADLLTLLSELSAQRSNNSLNIEMLSNATTVGMRFLDQKDRSMRAFVRTSSTATAWYIACLLLFTPVAIWLVLVLRRAVRTRGKYFSSSAPPKTPLSPPTVSQQQQQYEEAVSRSEQHFPGPQTSRIAMQPETTASVGRLERAYHTAAMQFIVTFFCLVAASGSGLWISIDTEKIITDPRRHAIAVLLTIWIFVIVGVLVNIFILIRLSAREQQTSAPSRPREAIRLGSLKLKRSRSEGPAKQMPLCVLKETTTDVVVEDDVSMMSAELKDGPWPRNYP